MNDSELCRRIAARYTYQGKPQRESWYDRIVLKNLPLIVLWGVTIFCIALCILSKRVY